MESVARTDASSRRHLGSELSYPRPPTLETRRIEVSFALLGHARRAERSLAPQDARPLERGQRRKQLPTIAGTTSLRMTQERFDTKTGRQLIRYQAHDARRN
jgi:hypothetical protein